MPDRWRLFEVTVTRGGEAFASFYSATSASKARMEAWRHVSDCWDVSFRDFLRIARVRSASVPAPGDCYGYVRRAYGVDVGIGDRVVLKNEGDWSGREGVVVHPGKSTTAHVFVALDGQAYASIVHPLNIAPAACRAPAQSLEVSHA